MRSAIGVCAVAGLFYLACATVLFAESRERGNSSRFIPGIDAAEGVERMANFRQQRLQGDYCFRFELEHLPRRGQAVVYQGTLWGSWNAIGPVSRFELWPVNESGSDTVQRVELIIQNGSQLAVWMRQGQSSEFQLVDGAALFEPIIPGVLYTPFDLQMPFIYWNEFSYEGPSRVLSRIAQWFRMFPPEGSAAADYVQAVRIGLDDTYDALLKVEVMGPDGAMRTDFKVESFKKVQQQYIVKEIALKDYGTRDRTRFQVNAASLGWNFDPSVFDPKLTLSVPEIPDVLFDVL